MKKKFAFYLRFITLVLCVNAETVEWYPDPFLLYFYRNSPIIASGTSASVVTQRIEYRDYDKKIVNYGDGEIGTQEYIIYLFDKLKLKGIDLMWQNNGSERRLKQYEFFQDDGTMYVRNYSTGNGRLLSQDTYGQNNDTLIANEGKRGFQPAVIVKNANKYFYFQSHRRYNEDKPATIIEFDGKDITVFSYTLTGELNDKRYYEDGILMRIEHRDGRIEDYTVRSGIGEIITTDTKEIDIRHDRLERRVDENGCLVFEGVRRANGTGYEYIVRKDIF
jgi:hypothetical protein